MSTITATEQAADAALHCTFRVAFARINGLGAQLLRDDLIALAHDEDLTIEQAARVLKTRLGGEPNLEPYVASLIAGYNRQCKFVDEVKRTTPARLLLNGQPAQRWPQEAWDQWVRRADPLFKDGERCSDANYFTPRPYVDEYNRGSERFGFTYTVQPGRHVCQITWR